MMLKKDLGPDQTARLELIRLRYQPDSIRSRPDQNLTYAMTDSPGPKSGRRQTYTEAAVLAGITSQELYAGAR